MRVNATASRRSNSEALSDLFQATTATVLDHQGFYVLEIQQLDLDFRIAFAEEADFAVLAIDERRLDRGYFEVEVVVRQVEIGGKALRQAATFIFFKSERS